MQQICSMRSCGGLLTLGATSRGLRLCTSCRDLMTGRLTSLPRLYRACEQALEVHQQHPIRVVRGRRPTGICLDERTVAVRSNTMIVLSSWCEMIVDERAVTGPSSLDVRMLTSFLRAHLDWLAAHVVAADFAEEIAGLVADAKQVLNPAQMQTMTLGPCAKDGCDRMVRATVGTSNRRPAPQVRCDAGHALPPRDWLELRRRLDLTTDPASRRTARGVPA
jgi:hypothetical protein